MDITCTPVNNKEFIGLGNDVYRYYNRYTGETLGYVGIQNGQVCFHSTKIVPLTYLNEIILDAPRLFKAKTTSANDEAVSPPQC